MQFVENQFDRSSVCAAIAMCECVSCDDDDYDDVAEFNMLQNITLKFTIDIQFVVIFIYISK